MKKRWSVLLVLVMLLGVLCSCDATDPVADQGSGQGAQSGADSNIDVDVDLDAEIPSADTDLSGNESKPDNGDRLERYNEAMALLEQGRLEESYAILLTMRDYKDVAEHLSHFAFHYERKISVDASGYSGGGFYYQYDTYGKVTQVHHDSSSISDYSLTYTYDENQRLIRQQYESAAGKQSFKYYDYDAFGNLIKQTNVDGETEHVTTVTYDERGNKTKVTWGKYDVVIEYRYDDADNLLELALMQTER